MGALADPRRDQGFSLLPHSDDSASFSGWGGDHAPVHTGPYFPVTHWFLLVSPNKTLGSESRNHILIFHAPPGLIPLCDIQQVLSASLLKNLIFKSNILQNLNLHVLLLQEGTTVRLGGRQWPRKSIQRKRPRVVTGRGSIMG